MKRDSIFRIASITKIVTAVAAMILVEDCNLRLDDPIDPWLPELANRRVLKSLSSEIDDTVPASRAITVRDLLTYRMGFGSVMAPPGTYPIQKLIREYHIGGEVRCCRRRRQPWTNGCAGWDRCRCWRNRASGGCIT